MRKIVALIGLAVPLAASAALIVISGGRGSASNSGGSDAPAWLTTAISMGATQGFWYQVGGTVTSGIGLTNTNELVDVNPCPADNCTYSSTNGFQDITGAWSGGALAPDIGDKGTLLAWGGGHSQFYGNGVYGWDIDARTWAQTIGPYTSANGSIPSDGEWPDGSPAVPHGWYNNSYHAESQSFVTTKVSIDNSGSGENTRVCALNLVGTPTWDCAAYEGGNSYGGWSAWDETRDRYYIAGGQFSGGALQTYTVTGSAITSGTYADHGSGYHHNQSPVTFGNYDPINDVIVLFVPAASDLVATVDATDLEGGYSAVTQAGSGPSTLNDGAAEWVDSLGGFVFHEGGGSENVFLLKYTSGGAHGGTWTWSALTSGSNTLAPSDPSQGLFNRFRCIAYPDGVEACFEVNSTTGPVYMFLLEDGI
jgi:hypothetical protein